MTTSRIESFLEELINSPSSTSRQSDVRRTHKILADALLELGFSIDWVRDSSGKTDDLLVAERPGRLNSFITCVSHIDTVLSPTEAGPYRREESAMGLRAKGAGIIDNKGGLAVLIESLRQYLEKETNPEVGLRVVSSPDEENGSSAWHETYRNLGLSSSAVLGFEPALDDGSIIESRRGNRWYNIDIAGTEAHAGRCRGEEINAAHAAARLTVRCLDLRDRLQSEFPNDNGLGISLNLGHIEGGRDRHNVVCGKIKMKLDTRFSTFEERDKLHSGLLEIFNSPLEKNIDGQSSKVTFEIVDDCPPFSALEKSKALTRTLCEIISSHENRQMTSKKAGGAGDVNHMSRPGLFILDGLGPVGGRMHTTEEFLELATLETRAKSLAEWYPTLIASLR